MRIELRRVQFIPKTLEPGVLYVAEEFGAAAHLCACGCGVKVRTPLSPTDWSLANTPGGPTLDPSIGNWQQPCQSHYWIRDGKVLWARKWTKEEIAAGRKREQKRAERYYETIARQRERSTLRVVASHLWHMLMRVFRRRQ